MARKQVIKPDFTINNMNAANNDPGVRTRTLPSFDFGSLVFSANANSEIFAADASMNDLEFGDGSNDVSFSFSIWIKYNPPTMATRYFAGNYSGAYYFGIKNTGAVQVSLIDGSVTNTFNSPQVGGTDIFDNEIDNWVLLTFVYTRDSDNTDSNHTEQVQFYKNGSAWGSAVESPNNSYVAMHEVIGATQVFTIGSYTENTNTTVNRFIGEMANFLVFRHDGQSGRSSSVLTDSEVLALYNDGVPMRDYTEHSKAGDLVAYWKLNEDVSVATQVTDYSGQDNHLANIGSAITSQSNKATKTLRSITWAQPRMIIPGLSSLRTNP